jgi:hypothetical protein
VLRAPRGGGFGSGTHRDLIAVPASEASHDSSPSGRNANPSRPGAAASQEICGETRWPRHRHLRRLFEPAILESARGGSTRRLSLLAPEHHLGCLDHDGHLVALFQPAFPFMCVRVCGLRSGERFQSARARDCLRGLRSALHFATPDGETFAIAENLSVTAGDLRQAGVLTAWSSRPSVWKFGSREEVVAPQPAHRSTLG